MAKKKDSKKRMTLEYLNEKARYLYVVISYYDEPKDALWDIRQRKLNQEEFDCLLEQLQKLRQYLFGE